MGEPVCAPKRNRSNGIPARAIRGRLSLFMIALGCSGSDGVAPAGADRDAGPSLAAVAGGGDIRGIEQLVEKFEAGFASKNAVTYASVYAEDADFVNPIGIVSAGRGAITTLHAAAFAGGFGPATLTADASGAPTPTAPPPGPGGRGGPGGAGPDSGPGIESTRRDCFGGGASRLPDPLEPGHLTG